MTIAEAARLLAVSRPFIYELIRRGKLTARRNPLYKKGPVRIPIADVEKLKQELAAS